MTTTDDPTIAEQLYGGETDEPLPDDADLYAGGADQPKPGTGDAAPEEEKPKIHIKRESAAKWIALVWASAGRKLQASGKDIPVGRTMQFNAPLAGNRFDEMLEGTFVDRLVQPLIRGADKAEGLGAVVLLPMLIGLYERNPEWGPSLYPFTRSLVEATLSDMAPVLKKERTERRKTAQAVADLSDIFEEMEIPKEADPIDFILGQLLAPPVEHET